MKHFIKTEIFEDPKIIKKCFLDYTENSLNLLAHSTNPE